MNGVVEVKKYDSGGFSDEHFEKTIKDGTFGQLLKGLELKQEIVCKNRIFDNVAGYLLDFLFGLGNCAYPYYDAPSSHSMLTYINLSTLDTDTTTYTEDWYSDWNTTNNGVAGSASTSSASKFFIREATDGAYNTSIKSDVRRESIIFRSSFVYLSRECISDNINGFCILFHNDTDSYNHTASSYNKRGRIGRVRFKDDDGNNVTLTKNSEEIITFDYIFTLVSF